MLKIQNKDGETIFEVKDSSTRPEATEIRDDEVCPKCKQNGPDKPGEYPCPICGRSLLHDEDIEEE